MAPLFAVERRVDQFVFIYNDLSSKNMCTPILLAEWNLVYSTSKQITKSYTFNKELLF